GMRTYVAVGGGVHGESLLGSRSHDTLGGIVPVALHEGVQLELGSTQESVTALDVVVAPRRIEHARLTPGPHEHLFQADLRSRVTRNRLTVSATSSRVGVRLTGASLRDAVTGELESFPLVRGAVQATQADELVVMLADHPTTGGYPVIGVVVPEDVDALAQLVSGATVSLVW
ncbi:MAG: allophanate hydrolase subunit 2 family protein, partial [Actinomycetales bacterium]